MLLPLFFFPLPLQLLLLWGRRRWWVILLLSFKLRKNQESQRGACNATHSIQPAHARPLEDQSRAANSASASLLWTTTGPSEAASRRRCCQDRCLAAALRISRQAKQTTRKRKRKQKSGAHVQLLLNLFEHYVASDCFSIAICLSRQNEPKSSSSKDERI